MTIHSTTNGLRMFRINEREFRPALAARVAVVLLFVAAPATADNLGWVGGTTEVNFVTPNAWMYAFSGGLGSTTDNPFTFNGGANFAYIGDSGTGSSSGKALLDSITGDNNSLQSIRIGHNNSSVNFTSAGGPNLKGNGQLRVEGATPITTKYAASPSGSGDFLVGGASGNNGTVLWNSTGTLTVGGALRVGQGGRGTFTQTAGTVIAGRDPNASSVFAAVANGGSTAANPSTYSLNNGTLEIGAALDTPTSGIPQEVRRNFRIGAGTGFGTFNLGDAMGDAGTAVLRTWDDIVVGQHSATDTTAVGTLNIKSDGRIEQNFAAVAKAAGIGGAEAPFIITSGTVNQTGGVVDTDGMLQFGKDPLTSKYLVTGSAGSLNVRALDIGATGTLGFTFDATGVMKMTVEGSTNTAGDTALGISLGEGATLNLTSLSTYASNSAVTLIESLDPLVIPTGTFANYTQGQAVGANSLGTTFYINYTGGLDNNDVVLQTTPLAGGSTADFDEDGDVDGADFLAWQQGLGTSTGATRAQGDSNNDGAVDGNDLTVWSSQFGSQAATGGVASVPEPAGIVVIGMAMGAVFRRRRS